MNKFVSTVLFYKVIGTQIVNNCLRDTNNLFPNELLINYFSVNICVCVYKPGFADAS